MGPALVAGVAYLDPGNVAANMTAGARYGYLLVWVIVLANLMAWIIQYFSAKLGIVTGQSLPEVLGERIRSKWARRAYWLQAELVAMATDIAEIIGGAVALYLLFGLPLLWGALTTGAVSLAILVFQSRWGARPFEVVIISLMAVMVVGFSAGLFVSPPAAGGIVAGLVPRFEGADSVLLAASVLGATIMPHAIYAHSSLSRDRHRPFARAAAHETGYLLRVQRIDVTVAMVIAGAVNLGMLLLAAGTLFGVTGTDSLEGAYSALDFSLGPVIATLFAVGLLASGLASSTVGAYAGAEIMRGLLNVPVPLMWRRIISLVPALIIVAVGVDPTSALIISQVVLSFGIPFALIPLLWLTARQSVLGQWRNHPLLSFAGGVSVVLVVALNLTLLGLLLLG